MAAAYQKVLTRVAYTAVVGGVVGGLVHSSLYTVEAGHKAVIFSKWNGIDDVPVDEGTHFLIPYLEEPHIFDTRIHAREIPSRTGSKDLQDVSITLRVLYKPDPKHLSTIFASYGLDYDDRILPSIGNEVLKAVVARFDAEALLSQREYVSECIRIALNQAAVKYHIDLVDIAITHLAFGREFTLAVERKQVAQQDAERQKFMVQIDEQEKVANIIRAEGEAEAATLVSNAYKEYGKAHLELRRIDAAREIAETLSRSKNVTYLPSGVNMLLNVGDKHDHNQ